MATSPGQAPKVQIDVTANTEDAVKKIAEVGTSAEKMADKVETVTTKSGRTFEKITSGAGQAAAAADRATNTIVKSIQRAQAAEAAGGRDQPDYYLNIAKQRGANISVIEKEVEKLKQLREANLANNATLADGATRLDKYGNTAKQTAAALRQVPAQFTDIVVSLQGGQAPLTVLLQQGGQLRDIFGSAGAAAQALGSYVAGLINPFTLVAAAAASIGYAFLQGSKEAEAFNKTLILTGGAAGVSADRLSDMARSISATNANITQSKAAEVLNGIAASGAIASDRLQKYTETAIRFEKAGGGAAEEVGKAFADLAADPLNAVEKLNKSTNFLTAEIYNQIKALDDQGRSTEAARIAQEAYNDALNDRIPKLVDNLGFLESAWNKVGDRASKAWDAMLDIGRPETLQERLEKAERLLQQYEADPQGRARRVVDINFGGEQGLRNQILGMRELLATQDRSDQQQRERLARERAGVDFAKQGMQYLSNRQKMEKEIAEAQELGRKAGLSRAQIEERILLIRDKYKEKTKKDTADPFAGERQAAKDWAQFYERFADANIKAQSAADGLTNTQNELVRFLLSPAYQKMDEPARQLALEQAYAAINTEATTKAIKEQEKATRSLAAAERGLQQDLAAQQAQYDREQAAIGRGGRARTLAGGISQINDRYRSQREKVQDRIAAFDVSDAERQALQQQLTLIDEYNRKATESYIKHFNDIEEAQGNWINGANEAINNYLDNSRNVAKMTEDLFTKSISGMEDALVTFVSTGKLSFRDLANSIIQDLIRIQIKKALVGLFGGIDLGNLFVGSSSSSSMYSLTSASNYNPGSLGLQARADGGPVSANSMYLVGERGPELFVPNTSGTILPNGVTPGGVTVNQVINVSTGVQQTVRAEIISLMPQIAGAAKSAVADAKLRGGSYAAALR